MRADSIVLAIAGMCFGIILGWVIAVQQGTARPATTTAAAPVGEGAQAQRQAPPLDEARVKQLIEAFEKDPQNAQTAVQLGNVYFDAERYEDAIVWYGQAMKLDPTNPNASTDLGVSYYYTGQTDRALQQFETSLKIDPRHTKTLLNQGIVRAFGKQDLAGASESWKQVVALAPTSPEGQAATRALEGIASAGHPAAGAPAP
jgi:cytochrome c-type biogenesis protein CcmH/NrfG